jgi:hypothetical protein
MTLEKQVWFGDQTLDAVGLPGTSSEKALMILKWVVCLMLFDDGDWTSGCDTQPAVGNNGHRLQTREADYLGKCPFVGRSRLSAPELGQQPAYSPQAR